MNKNSKKIIKDKVTQAFKEKLAEAYNSKSKVRYLLEDLGQNRPKPIGARKAYLQKLNRLQSSTIFQARSRMLEFKGNYKNKYSDLACRLCKQAEETQDHVLFSCSNNGSKHNDKMIKEMLFSDNIEELKQTAFKINKILELLEDLESAPPSGNLAIQASA